MNTGRKYQEKELSEDAVWVLESDGITISSAYYSQAEEPILQAILTERRRQDIKWGQQNHSPVEWLTILGEEYGESCKAALETNFAYEGADKDYSSYEKELVEVAEVAISAIENLRRDRRKNGPS